MKLERSDIKFPLWRKKIDASLLKDAATPIPKWLWKIWNLEELFVQGISKKSQSSDVNIVFNSTIYRGRVLLSRGGSLVRLFFDKKLANLLKDVFLMTYMRSIEQDLRKGKNEYKGQEIENEIPFWEFLDIEFNLACKEFHFSAYYIQKPAFVELFKELVNSHTLKVIDSLINENEDFRFVKQDWRPRNKLKSQIDAKNVIYNLIDTNKKKIYIGEAEALIHRLNQERKDIKGWNFYRFDCLPPGLTRTQRVAIERLLIRTFASFFKNKKEIYSMDVSNYELVNEKIDL